MHLPVILRINKVTSEVFTLSVSLFLMTGRHFRITDAFTDVIGAAGGHRGRFAPVCSFPLSGVSIAQVAGRLSQDQQAMRPAPLPPGGALRGCYMFIVCNIHQLLSMLYSLIALLKYGTSKIWILTPGK